MPAPPSKDSIAGSGSTPSNAQARAGFDAVWENLYGTSGLLGPTGNPIDARAALRTQLEPGVIAFVPYTTPPPGWLKSNGAAIAVASYPDLAALLYVGNTLNPTALFGYRTTSTSSPSTNRSTSGQYIVLPDLRGEFIRGWDDSRGVDAARVFGSAQADEFRSHQHYIAANTVFGTTGTAEYNLGGVGNRVSGFAGGAETRPRNVALLPIIKY